MHLSQVPGHKQPLPFNLFELEHKGPGQILGSQLISHELKSLQEPNFWLEVGLRLVITVFSCEKLGL